MSAGTVVAENAPLYDQDFHDWTVTQARALRERRPKELDWANLAEEIETLGRSDKRAIESNLNILLVHLLKWRFQPEGRKGGWRSSIREHRARIDRIIAESPSLCGYPEQVLGQEYELARARASDKMGLPENRFPTDPPFSIDEILDPDFWPA
jgi:hypothetical protein